MKHFSAQYVFTNEGPPLKRGIISVKSDGTIARIEDSGGNLSERESAEFHNGIIIPGFVNCHCHLELSHMKGRTTPGKGLAEFLKNFRTKRENGNETMLFSAAEADREMYSGGVVLCADICNTRMTFDIKKKSRIKYISLLEVFGLQAEKAGRRMDEVLQLAAIAHDYNLPYSIVPHAAYSISLTLFRLLKEVTAKNTITSLHFMETEAEKTFLKYYDGPLMESYRDSELLPENREIVSDHAEAVLEEVTPSGNLILVHNTFVDRTTIRKVRNRKNLYWCLCPRANLYIEDRMPPVDLLTGEGCRMVIGTDSLASNNSLDILAELKVIQANFQEIPLAELVKWATLNGAAALRQENTYGSIRRGKKPGLLLLQDVDLQNMKLLPQTRITRLA
ncbi:MAG: amidohydrolase family protein [Bacteroidales bacterium]|nr:amidohydrolase family protein [Bacteroidales bacterium]